MLATPPKSAESRSQRGCWTCRLRKKKCDETRPKCSICVGLELECHGYSDKPIWMDYGPLQRDQALRTKRIVSRTNSRRRKQQVFLPIPDNPANLENNETSASKDASASYFPDEVPLNRGGWNTEILGKEDQFYTWNNGLDPFVEDILSTPFQGLPSTAEPFSKNRRWEIDLAIDDNVSSEHDSMRSICSRVSESSMLKSIPRLDPSTKQRVNEVRANDESQEGMHLEIDTDPTSEWPLSSHWVDVQSFRVHKVVQEHSTIPNHLNDSVQREELEDNLLMHYLDVVYYVQYPFCKPSFKQSRSWLLSSLRRASSVYHATLALSELHLRLTVEKSLLPTSFNKVNYYNMAIQEMELTMGENSTGLSHSMDRITYVLQALWYELFTGSTGNWRSYLLTASTFISPHIRARMKSTRPVPLIMGSGARQSEETDMLFKDDAATKILLGSFIMFDIMACASTRSQPTLGQDHQHILDTFEIDLGDLFGCANQVMVLILETVLLDNWKGEAERNRRLSMVELVKRGSKIESRLHQVISDLERSHYLRDSNWEANSGNTSSASRDEITNIFALSTLTYLHIVVSGPQPELPDIAQSVSKTIAAFKSLSEPTLLWKLVWPFCVSGCLALEEHQEFFRETFSQAKAVSSSIGTCEQAFVIMEQCWRMRKSAFHNYCWVSSMNELNSSFILI